MSSQFNRRKFLIRSTVAGLSGCAFLISARYNPLRAFNHLPDNEEPIDPSKLNYCGYICPADCMFLKATQENNIELKKEAFKQWHIKEKHGIDFDPEKTFCWSCKAKNKPLGVITGNCTVRSCAIEKGYEACIECNNLKTCDKELWKGFPDFHKSVIEMQKTYQG